MKFTSLPKPHIILLGSNKGKCDCGGGFENLLLPLIENGKAARKLPKPKDIREYVLEQLKNLSTTC
ncbi:MAG: hypothetical protein HZB79_05405 [Deltaproteobacteria bacterium]|nr:hypothetical protein [Deltaproteobacteria bacterium]